MDKSLKITGIKRDDDPPLYDSIEKIMKIFGLGTIYVKFRDEDYVNTEAKSDIKNGDTLIITHKALEKLTNNEIETCIAHEFNHLYNRDLKLKTITILLIYFVYPFLWLRFFVFVCVRFHFTNMIIFLLLLALLVLPLFYMNKIKIKLFTLMEIRSDIEAAIRTQKFDEMKSALAKAECYNGIKKKQYPLSKKIRKYIDSHISGNVHPPMQKRIEYLEFIRNVKINVTNNQKRPNLSMLLNQIWKCVIIYTKGNYILPMYKVVFLDYAIDIQYNFLH
jgi:Zn-dependent protease with chaperone function